MRLREIAAMLREVRATVKARDEADRDKVEFEVGSIIGELECRVGQMPESETRRIAVQHLDAAKACLARAKALRTPL